MYFIHFLPRVAWKVKDLFRTNPDFISRKEREKAVERERERNGEEEGERKMKREEAAHTHLVRLIDILRFERSFEFFSSLPLRFSLSLLSFPIVSLPLYVFGDLLKSRSLSDFEGIDPNTLAEWSIVRD